jgi:hypothetical protein
MSLDRQDMDVRSHVNRLSASVFALCDDGGGRGIISVISQLMLLIP